MKNFYKNVSNESKTPFFNESSCVFVMCVECSPTNPHVTACCAYYCVEGVSRFVTPFLKSIETLMAFPVKNLKTFIKSKTRRANDPKMQVCTIGLLNFIPPTEPHPVPVPSQPRHTHRFHRRIKSTTSSYGLCTVFMVCAGQLGRDSVLFDVVRQTSRWEQHVSGEFWPEIS